MDRTKILALVDAAIVLGKAGRTESRSYLITEALIHAGKDLQCWEGVFGLGKKARDFPLALTARHKLVELLGAIRSTPASERKRKVLQDDEFAALDLIRRLDRVDPIETVPGRVLYALNYALPQVSNGYTTRAQGLIEGMQACGVDVIAVTRPGFPVDVGKDFVRSDKVDGVVYLHDAAPVLSRKLKAADYLQQAADVYEKRIREFRPEVVIAASNYNTALPALLAARRCGLPFWNEVRGFWELSRLAKEPEIADTFNFWIQRELDAVVARESDKVFTLTGPMKAELVRRGASEQNIKLLPNSTDANRFSPRTRKVALAAKLGIPGDVPVIGYVGSFVSYEGLPLLAHACAELKRLGREFRLMLVGGEQGSAPGPIANEVQTIAEEAGYSNWLIMPGRVPHKDVEDYYSLIDITPFPRLAQEVTQMVSPLKILEALAMGKAAVVPSLDVFKELVAHESTGLVYKQDDAEDLAKALDRFILDGSLRDRLGDAGRKWVISQRTWKRTAQTIAAELNIPDERKPWRDLVSERGFGEATQLLYADVDLNIIDGSAIWASSMASILSGNGKTILISKAPIKRDAVVANILNSQNLLILSPRNLVGTDARMTIQQCAEQVRIIDREMPLLRTIVTRGAAATSELLADRQFYGRIYAYLTDLYTHGPDGIEAKQDAGSLVDILARQAAGLLVQTPEIARLMQGMTKMPLKTLELPPPIPDGLWTLKPKRTRAKGPIRIGYAGKIAPAWGIQQLTEWLRLLRQEGLNIELTVIGDKIGGASTTAENDKFKADINAALDSVDARRLGALARADVLEEMAQMDFAWCWRPSEFEDHTLELSTKLVEGVAAGQRCIVWPSAINKRCLSDDYPFFVRDVHDLRRLLAGGRVNVPKTLRAHIQHYHGLSALTHRLGQEMALRQQLTFKKLVVAAHDPKFIHPYTSSIKRRGNYVIEDVWSHSKSADFLKSLKYAGSADVILCEWGLGNLNWYSHNLPAGPRLVVRMHLQEVVTAQAHARGANLDRVDAFIFVSDWVRNQAVGQFGLPNEKCFVIPNFVLDEEYAAMPRLYTGRIKLGMIGIVPQRKRVDRAIDLLSELISTGHDAELIIKGKRPGEYPWMLSPSRSQEMAWYRAIEARIEGDPALEGRVTYHGWGNDVGRFYESVEHILSPSDFESFHYALADGILSGCHPVIWNWADADKLYDPQWVVVDHKDAAARIVQFRNKSIKARTTFLQEARQSLVKRYGAARVFEALDRVLFPASEPDDAHSTYSKSTPGSRLP